MTIQDWAAVAEIVGGIAVVVTLLYLAMQIRDSNRETRAITLQSVINNDLNMNSALVENAATWHKVITGVPLEEGEETRKGILLYNLLMIENEGRFLQYKTGYLDTVAWEQRLPAIRITIRNPIHKIWRASPGAAAHSLSFLQMLDELEKEDSGE
jgi:hypothetical protein